MAQSTDLDEGAAPVEGADPYAKIVRDILAMPKADQLEKDSDAIVARLVEELKKKNPLPEGTSEEPLFRQARDMYWAWQDAQRAKKKSGKEEYLDDSPMACCN